MIPGHNTTSQCQIKVKSRGVYFLEKTHKTNHIDESKVENEGAKLKSAQ